MKSISTKRKHKAEQKKKNTVHESHEEFNEDQVITAWNTYIKTLKKKGRKILASILASDKPKVEGTVLKIELPNDTMKVEVEREQGHLMSFIKRKIKNTDITLEIIVNKEAAKEYAFTPLEKYNKLKEKNPLVEKLKDTFDLDV